MTDFEQAIFTKPVLFGEYILLRKMNKVFNRRRVDMKETFFVYKFAVKTNLIMKRGWSMRGLHEP